MNKQQENKLSMLKELYSFWVSNGALLAAIPTSVDSKIALKSSIDSLESQMIDQMTNIKSHTADKARKKEDLLKPLLQELTRLSLLGSVTSNDFLIGAASVTRSKLEKLRDSVLVVTANNLLATLNANAAALMTYGTTAANLANIQTRIDAYDEAIGDKSLAFIRRVSGTRGINQTLAKTLPLVKRMRQAASLTDNPTLIAQFEDAAKIDNIGVRHYSVEGTITDDEDGLAVAGALITLYGANGNKHTDKTNELGFYHLKGLGAGEYKMTVQRSGFFDHVANILIRRGNLSKVDVALAFDNSGVGSEGMKE